MPKVSVVIPTHNRAELLRSAITSVLNQTFQDFEIIVADDASSDNTKEVVSGLNDRRIKYVRNEINKGDAVARNVGVMNSSYEYVALLDDDDEWLPEKLERQINLFEKSQPEVGAVYTSAFDIDRTSGEIVRIRVPKKKGNLINEMLMENCITTSTLLLRKSCFERVGLFDESIPYCSDYDMWIRISKEFHFEYIEEPLVKHFIHQNRLSNNPAMQIKGIEMVLKKHSQFFSLSGKSLSHQNLLLGWLYCYSGDTKKGREAFLNAIKLYPFEIRNYFNFGLSLLGVSGFKRIREIKEKIVSPLKRTAT